MNTIDISPYFGASVSPLVSDIDPNQFLKEDPVTSFLDSSVFSNEGPSDPVSPSSDSGVSGLGVESSSSVTSLDAPNLASDQDDDIVMNQAPPVPSGNPPKFGMSTVKAEQSFPTATAVAVPAGVAMQMATVTTQAPAPTTGIDGNTIMELLKEQDVKRARLARKAELARMSRKRKKMRMQDLEREVSELRTGIEREKKLRKIAQDECKTMREKAAKAQFAAMVDNDLAKAENTHQMMEVESQQLNASLKQELKSESPNLENLKQYSLGLKSLTQKMVMANTDHLNTIRQRIAPPMPLAFVEWVLNQRDPFYEDKSGLWNSLFHSEVGLSTEQMQQVFALRNRIRAQKSLSTEVQQAFERLQQALKGHVSQASTNMEELLGIFTPEQLAKFYSWVDTYGKVCVKINV